MAQILICASKKLFRLQKATRFEYADASFFLPLFSRAVMPNPNLHLYYSIILLAFVASFSLFLKSYKLIKIFNTNEKDNNKQTTNRKCL